jgi:monoamine oxidase
VIYPSDGFNRDKGVLVGAYAAGWTNPDNPDAFAALSNDEQFRIVRESIEALHPGKSRLLAKPITVRWGRTPYSEGVSPAWPGNGGQGPRPTFYAELFRPEGPIVFAGEHLSYQPAWQEGAAVSAHEALKLIHAMAAERTAAAA